VHADSAGGCDWVTNATYTPMYLFVFLDLDTAYYGYRNPKHRPHPPDQLKIQFKFIQAVWYNVQHFSVKMLPPRKQS
jgi:hypothetical protein